MAKRRYAPDRRGVKAFRHILDPSDFSPRLAPRVRRAVDLAKTSRAELLVAHVLPVLPLIPDAYIAATTYDELLRGQRAGAKKQLDRLVEKRRRPALAPPAFSWTSACPPSGSPGWRSPATST